MLSNLTPVHDAYDAAGWLASVSRANGAVTTDAYDGADRLRDRHTTVDGTTVSRTSTRWTGWGCAPPSPKR